MIETLEHMAPQTFNKTQRVVEAASKRCNKFKFVRRDGDTLFVSALYNIYFESFRNKKYIFSKVLKAQ